MFKFLTFNFGLDLELAWSKHTVCIQSQRVEYLTIVINDNHSGIKEGILRFKLVALNCYIEL